MKKILVIILCILVSALAFYFSDGLSGRLYFLQWIAPVPILVLSFNSGAGKAFLVSFIAAFLGRLGWLGYLGSVMPPVPALIVVTMLTVVFALIVLLTRFVVIKVQAWYAVFAFPIFITAYELLFSRFSYDGTAASIAYTQADFLPIIQIASVSGLSGITFIVSFIASFLALLFILRKNKKELIPLLLTGISLIGMVFIFGLIRLSSHTPGKSIPVSLIVLNEESHKFELKENQYEIKHAENYAAAIAKYATPDVKLVVLPERALNINREIDSAIFAILSNIAITRRITIITGYSNYKNDKPGNSALVIDDNGDVIADYDKIHLVKGLESQFQPGNKTAVFSVGGIQSGVAICKDLDYPGYISQYGRDKVSFLCVPAWDFSVDGWLHSRMAIMRGVENGFSEIRTARTGRLTVSDPYGRVTSEASCESGIPVILNASIHPERVDTLYSRFGDWLGWVTVMGAVLFVITAVFKRRSDKDAMNRVSTQGLI
ncbi:MAG TPA: nitrilase-related carbon-nitrogen hydrolase [Bacteroidales bacterium]|nr:nitrilase-related carbon-nitrogen hydrolase [Bacteroidales bacterium]